MNVYMLDYLNMILLSAGVFRTPQDAERWVTDHAPERPDFYKVITLTVNAEGYQVVPYDAPVRRYACQK